MPCLGISFDFIRASYSWMIQKSQPGLKMFCFYSGSSNIVLFFNLWIGKTIMCFIKHLLCSVVIVFVTTGIVQMDRQGR